MAFLSRQVRDYRYKKLRSVMRSLDLDALILTSPDFFQFASNFHVDVLAWERPFALVVPLDSAAFALMHELSTNHVKTARERGTFWLDDVTHYAEHQSKAQRPATEWPSIFADLITAKSLAAGRFGIDTLSGPIRRALELLPQASVSEVTSHMRATRWVKHAEELSLMRELANLTDWVQDRYRENIKPGRMLMSLDCDMASMMAEEAALRFPGEHLEILRCWTLAGKASASPHGGGGELGQRIENGQVLINLVIPRLNGLVVENERTWFCGKPDEQKRQLFEAARGANEAAIAQMRPGNRVRAIEDAARAVIETAGYGDYILHRTGHGMGIVGHEFPEDMAWNDRELLADEVYSAEPGIYVYGLGGFRCDDTVIVADEPESLTRSPKDILSQTIQ